MSRDYPTLIRTRTGQAFEDRIRRLIRDYFRIDHFDEDLLPRTIAEGEVDILHCDDGNRIVYCIEASTCRKKDYVEHKISGLKRKNVELRNKYPHYNKQFWFVFEEPQDQQLKLIDIFNNDENSPFQIVVFSIDQLMQLVEDNDKGSFENWYFGERIKYPFGSARNPKNTSNTNEFDISKIEYLPCNIYQNDSRVSLENMADTLIKKHLCILTGEYGLGKSLSLGQLFLQFKTAYDKGERESFPIFINLNTVNTIDSPKTIDKLFQRHLSDMSNKQFSFDMVKPIIENENCILIFDGLDEITEKLNATPDDSLLQNKKNLEFFKEYLHLRKGRQGIIVSVRSNFFFDFEQEIKEYLNLSATDYVHYNLKEFSSEEAEKLFNNFGATLPKDFPFLKPLLLSKLAVDNFFSTNEKSDSFDEIVDMIISREYNGHFSSKNELTETQFRKFIFEVISYSMSLPKYDRQITEKTLSDIYNLVVERNPTINMENDLKKLMIFNPAGSTSVQLYDEQIVDSISIRIIESTALDFFNIITNKTIQFKKYDEVLKQAITNTGFNADTLKNWKRMLARQESNLDLYAHLNKVKWFPTIYMSLITSLNNAMMCQLAFLIFNAFNITDKDSVFYFSNLAVDQTIDTSIFSNHKEGKIQFSNSMFDHINIHNAKLPIKFDDCLILRISFKDYFLSYKEDIKYYNISQMFSGKCEIGLQNEPDNIPKSKSMEAIRRTYREKKAQAVFWCMKKIQNKANLNRRFFYQGLQNEKLASKEVDWALKKLVTYGFISTYYERGNTMYKKDNSEAIDNSLNNNKLPRELDNYFRES